ncbi:hypothetical protein ASZ90_008917 [hydrocarbon metagenome]|uniref:Uncharacterized protein n=1 Tax=hydrocarbon metagenome TaxID=938273 RepID=A0A0W8FK89_9ZZZZ
MALVFGPTLGVIAMAGFGAGLILPGGADCLVPRGESADAAITAGAVLRPGSESLILWSGDPFIRRGS